MPVTAKPESVGLSSARLERIKPWMQGYLDARKLPGALTLVARRGEIVLLETAGYIDVETQVPLTEDSIFRFYSMTKPITSVAAMMLYEQGLFQLDDPVSRYIPAFADMEVYVDGEGQGMATIPASQPMTIQNLFTHTSGLTYGFFSTTPVGALYREHKTDFSPDDDGLAAGVERLARLPLEFHPGSRWHYGVSTDVLGHLVEVLSGQSLEQFFHEHIFDPLGMVDTGFSVPEEKVDRFPVLYTPHKETGLQPGQPAAGSPYTGKVTTFSGGAGLVSTAGDYYRFTEMLRRKGEFNGERLLGRKTVEFMTSNHLPGDLASMGQASFNETTFEGVGFGLGLSVTLDPAAVRLIGSPGEYAWGGAASTAFWVDPLEDMTVIFLTQLIPSDSYPVRRELRVLTYQALVD